MREKVEKKVRAARRESVFALVTDSRTNSNTAASVTESQTQRTEPQSSTSLNSVLQIWKPRLREVTRFI